MVKTHFHDGEMPCASDRNIREMGGAVIGDGDGHFHIAGWYWAQGHACRVEAIDPEPSMDAFKRSEFFEDLCTYLTDRQYEVLVLWRMGKTQRTIATILGVGQRYVCDVQEYICKKAQKIMKKPTLKTPIRGERDHSLQIEAANRDILEDHWNALPEFLVPPKEIPCGKLNGTLTAPRYLPEQYVPPPESVVNRAWSISTRVADRSKPDHRIFPNYRELAARIGRILLPWRVEMDHQTVADLLRTGLSCGDEGDGDSHLSYRTEPIFPSGASPVELKRLQQRNRVFLNRDTSNSVQ